MEMRRAGAGRPKGSGKLPTSPRRYLYALTELAIRNAGPRSTESICIAFALLNECRPLRPGEFIIGKEPVSEDFRESWRRDEQFWVVHRSWDSMSAADRAEAIALDKGRVRSSGIYDYADWKKRKLIRASAASMRRTLDRWRASTSDPNRRWLEHMGAAMKICFEGFDHLSRNAEACAVEIGELRYFDRYLRPIMVEHANYFKAEKDIPNIGVDGLLELIYPDFGHL
jgi:hypothetical protein